MRDGRFKFEPLGSRTVTFGVVIGRRRGRLEYELFKVARLAVNGRSVLSAQRTAVKQRPHQETERLQVATTEPVVLHHGREDGGAGGDDVRSPVFNGLLGGARNGERQRGSAPLSIAIGKPGAC